MKKKFSMFEVLFLAAMFAAARLYFSVPEQHIRYKHAITALKGVKGYILG